MRTMASLTSVDSNGVRQEVIDRVEQFRQQRHHENPRWEVMGVIP
jgi:hypothetical protein